MYKGVWYNKKILDAGERVNMIKWKILKITENAVYIGYEDGSLKEIPIESCEFEPRMGDYVEVYQSEETYIISKKSSEVPTENKEVYWTVERIKSVAWAGVFAIVALHNFFYCNSFHNGKTFKRQRRIWKQQIDNNSSNFYFCNCNNY